jgi:hypothetical protein
MWHIDFEGSVGAQEMIHLHTVNDPRPGGHASPRRWWGFASSGIREYNFVCIDKEKKEEDLEPCRQEDAETDQWSMQPWKRR